MNKSENTEYLEGILLQKLQEDDQKALAYLFSNFYNVLFRHGIRFSNNYYLTEESIQEVFEDLWKYRKTIGNINSFEGYLKTSLKNKILKKATTKLNFNEENIDNHEFPTASFEHILIAQESSEHQKNEIKLALDLLSSRQKEIIVYKYFDELSYKEISEKTGLQVDSIYKTLHEAIKKLKLVIVKH